MNLQEMGELGEFFTAIVGVLTLLFISFQIRDFRKTVRGQTYQAVYSEMLRLDQFFLDYVELREHFYDGKTLAEDPKIQSQAKIAAEMICDFFDNLFLQRLIIDPQEFKEWEQYMIRLVINSPILDKSMRSHNKWYSPEFLERMEELRKIHETESQKTAEGQV